MGDEVAVSYPGLRMLRDLLDEQTAALHRIDDYLRAGGAYASDSFDTGILRFFQGAYDAAAADLSGSFDRGTRAASRVARGVGDCAAEMRATDEGVGELMSGLGRAVSGISIPPWLGVPAGVLGAGAIESASRPAPRHRAPTGPRSLSGVVRAADHAVGTADQVRRTMAGTRTQREIDEFLDETAATDETEETDPAPDGVHAGASGERCHG